MALDAKFRVAGPSRERTIPAAEFFALPKINAAKENILGKDEILASIHLPRAAKGIRSTYHKVLDREAWTHAVVSVAAVLEMDGQVCKRARIVLGGVAPIPWRLDKVDRPLLRAQPRGNQLRPGAQPRCPRPHLNPQLCIHNVGQALPFRLPSAYRRSLPAPDFVPVVSFPHPPKLLDIAP